MIIILAEARRRIIQEDSSDEEEQEEDELNSSDNDSDSDNETRTKKSKRKPATRRKATKTVPSAFLNNSSQLLVPVTQDSSTQDSLYGNANIPKKKERFETYKCYRQSIDSRD